MRSLVISKGPRYINYIIVLVKGSFSHHIDHLIAIFARLCATGLKTNAPKCSVRLKDILYLGYIITREWTKPGPYKVQGIMDLRRPTTMTEAQELIGVVHYYRYMCPRRSYALSPLTKSVSGVKG